MDFSTGSQLEVDHSHDDCAYDEIEPNGSDRSDENHRENSFASFEDLDPFTIALGAPSDAFHGSAETSPVENVS